MIFMLFNHATWHVPLISFRMDFGWDTLLPPLPLFTPYMGIGLIQGTPLFFIMAGFSVALFEHARRRKGWTEWQITRFLLIRGGVLIAIDWLVLPWQFYPQPGYAPNVYYVLTTIAICLWFVAFLRLLPVGLIFVIALVCLVAVQAIYKAATSAPDADLPQTIFSRLGSFDPITFGFPALLARLIPMMALVIPVAVLVIGKPITSPPDVDLLRMIFLYMTPLDPITFGFPVLPWLGMILLGYITMRYLNTNPQHFARMTLGISVMAWCLWLIISYLNEFGVLFPLHPLLMTKHPPSLAYLTFYAGVTYLLLYLLHICRPIQERFPLNRIALLGQTALTFYILHFYVIDIFSALLQNIQQPPFIVVLLIATLSLLLLYGICTRYRFVRKAYPNSLLKYL